MFRSLGVSVMFTAMERRIQIRKRALAYARYMELLRGVVEHADTVPVRALKMVTDDEQHALAVTARNRTARADFRLERGVVERFDAAVAAAPHAAAFELLGEDDAVHVVTFSEVQQRARALAARLREVVPAEGSNVGIYIRQTSEKSAIAIIGVLCASCVYVPMDVLKVCVRVVACGGVLQKDDCLPSQPRDGPDGRGGARRRSTASASCSTMRAPSPSLRPSRAPQIPSAHSSPRSSSMATARRPLR